MKRIFIISLMALMLTGCGSKVSITDTNEVLDFAYDNYLLNTTLSAPVTRELYAEKAQQIIYDFNDDGKEDILVYCENSDVSEIVSVISVKKGDFVELPNEIITTDKYSSQKFDIEDDLLIRYTTYESPESTDVTATVYVPKKDKIYFTEPSILVSRVSYVNTVYSANVNKTQGFKEFSNDIEWFDENGVKVGSSVNKYTLGEDNKYQVVQYSGFEKAEKEYVYPREKMSEEEFLNSEYHEKRPNVVYSEYYESLNNRLLIDLEKEIINGEEIDYSQYAVVIVPNAESKNANILDKKIETIVDDTTYQFKISFFGEVEGLTLESDNSFIGLEPLKNTELTINAGTPTINISGKYYMGEGSYEYFDYELDKDQNIIKYPVYK